MNKELLAVARGLKPADLVVNNGKIVNVFSGEIYDGGVAVCGDTIAAVGDVANVSRAITVPIWMGCCETVSVRNTSDQPIQVQNANIIIRRPDLQGN